MPRIIRLDATAPLKIDPKTLNPEKPLSICACGLSQTFPICDGAHKAARACEQPGMLYTYDKERRQIISECPDA